MWEILMVSTLPVSVTNGSCLEEIVANMIGRKISPIPSHMKTSLSL